MSNWWDEFRRFAVKGNALELAVAVLIGNAFGQIVNSLVGDILTPLLGLLPGANSGDLKTLSAVLRPSYIANGTTTPALSLNYGSFLGTIINFFIIALSIFVVFKLLSGMRRRFFARGEEEKTPEHEKPPQERLLEEIRDLLKEQTEK